MTRDYVILHDYEANQSEKVITMKELPHFLNDVFTLSDTNSSLV